MTLTLLALMSIFMCITIALILPRQEDLILSGEYAIAGCGANADSMVTMLETLWGAVLKATQDAESSTTSDAYLTFFKDPENKAFVSNILAQVSEGAAIHPPTSVNNGAPVFRCLDGFGQLAGRLSNGRQYDAFGFCQAHSHSLSQFNLPSTPYVGICPYFWDAGLGSTHKIPPLNQCLTVNQNNMFSKDRRGLAGPSLTQFGMWILLEEIVHIYLSPSQEKLGLVTAQQKAIYETHDANDVVNKLTPAQTLLNAHSYCLYVASIYGGCTDFPSPSGSRPPERELGEVSSVAAIPPGPAITGDPAGVEEPVVAFVTMSM